MEEKTPVYYINIDGNDYKIIDINRHYFYSLSEIIVEGGDSYIVGDEYMFRDAARRYYDGMSDSDLADDIGAEVIVCLWKSGITYSDWLHDIGYEYGSVVPSWDGVELQIGEPSDDFIKEVIGIDYNADPDNEWNYFNQLHKAFGFSPEIAFLSLKAGY